MAEETVVCIDVLAKRLDALKSLSAGLLGSRRAVRGLDLEKVLESIVSQESLCEEMRSFEQQMERLQDRFRECAGALPGGSPSGTEWDVLLSLFEPGAQEKVRRLLGELKNSQTDIRRLNRIHAELLRRSRRTVRALVELAGHNRGSDEASPAGAPESVDASARK